jgi:hypothetical protein
MLGARRVFVVNLLYHGGTDYNESHINKREISSARRFTANLIKI